MNKLGYAFLIGGLSFSPLINAASSAHLISGHTYEWHWQKGAFAGAGFNVSFHNDGSLLWKGIAGGMKGKHDTEKMYSAREISSNVQLVSWQEKSGYTVTIVLNFSDHSCHGVVSNGKEWYPLDGTFAQKN